MLEALKPSPARDTEVWFSGKHNAPTSWCIANEQRIIKKQQQAAADAARAEKEATEKKVMVALRRAREEAAREWRCAGAQGQGTPTAKAKAHRHIVDISESDD